MLRIFTFVLLCLSTIVLASPFDRKSNSPLDTRQNTCVSQLRKNKGGITIKGRDLTFLDEDGFEDLDSADFQKRDFVKDAQCYVTGSFSKHFLPTQSKKSMSQQGCSDWCKCTLTRADCKTMQWKEYPAMPGLGTCYIYKEGLKHMGFVPGAGADGPFFERGCYKKETATMPPPYQTTTPPSYSTAPPSYSTAPPSYYTAAPVVKREDSSEKFWALVLAEA